MKSHLLKAVSLLLIASLTSGCASSTRAINFSSTPAGATVSAGSSTCTTPCELKVPVNTATAEVTLASGEKQEVSIRHITAENAEMRYRTEKTGEMGFAVTSAPFLVVGGVCTLIAGLYDSERIKSEHPSRDEDIFMAVGLAAGLVGILLFSASWTMGERAREIKPAIHVSFQKPAPEPDPVNIMLKAPNSGALKLFPDSVPKPNNQLK